MSAHRYLQYPSVQKFLTAEAVRADDVKIVVYDSVLYKVIPNPLNTDVADACKHTWDSGMYFARTHMYCPKSVFDDDANWDE